MKKLILPLVVLFTVSCQKDITFKKKYDDPASASPAVTPLTPYAFSVRLLTVHSAHCMSPAGPSSTCQQWYMPGWLLKGHQCDPPCQGLRN